jgi:hypothetical protein
MVTSDERKGAQLRGFHIQHQNGLSGKDMLLHHSNDVQAWLASGTFVGIQRVVGPPQQFVGRFT